MVRTRAFMGKAADRAGFAHKQWVAKFHFKLLDLATHSSLGNPQLIRTMTEPARFNGRDENSEPSECRSEHVSTLFYQFCTVRRPSQFRLVTDSQLETASLTLEVITSGDHLAMD